VTPRRRKRLTLAGVLLAAAAIATALLLTAFSENLVYFHTPAEVAHGKVPTDQRFRVGGLVAEGSVERADDELDVRFVVSDGEGRVPVVYDGVMPDLFAEGQGIVADGHLNEGGVFVADSVLAKHDENYMPPEAAEALERANADGNTSSGGSGSKSSP
jgi:cytochrome c-type biogenesis protein CcmE